MKGYAKDLRLIAKQAEDQGWNVSKTRSNHYRFKSPAGRIYFTASTASDYRTIKNTIAGLRKLGLNI